MKIRQWEVWKARPPGFEREHWFVIVSGQERCDETKHMLVNGLACFSYRDNGRKSEVRLNGADGFSQPTVCQCDFLYSIAKSGLHDCLVGELGTATTDQSQAQRSVAARAILRSNKAI
jgi:hypothetical protein